MMLHAPEKYRVKTGPARSTIRDGNNGAFFVRSLRIGVVFKVVCSDGEGWEHVSVSLQGRCPTWDEMCFIKDLFWDAEDEVMQFHPPKSQYVNLYPYCLHMWRPTEFKIPLPEPVLVGPK